jgi:hypothetical protein
MQSPFRKHFYKAYLLIIQHFFIFSFCNFLISFRFYAYIFRKRVKGQFIWNPKLDLYMHYIDTSSLYICLMKNLQSQHSKICDIKYPIFETQKYMTSPLYINHEVNLLNALRSRSINAKNNFTSKYRNYMSCPICYTGRDDQQHILDCSVLKNKLESKDTVNNKVVYEDIFEDYLRQKEVTHLSANLLKIRNSLLDINLHWIPAPYTSAEMLEDHDSLHTSIVHNPSRK